MSEPSPDATRAVSVAFRTLGCKVNHVESEDIAADLIGRGARLSGEDEAAVVVINTCTVTGEADAKARKAVRHALKAAAEPLVVVTGCLASVDRASLEALDERVVVEPDKSRVAELVAKRLGLDSGPRGHEVRAGADFHTRAMLKVEDGCDNFCSYCIVPYARGVPRGVALGEAEAEASALVSAGVREIVLTGINIGRYRDQASGADLAALVTAIAGTGIERLRLSSIEPPDLTREFLAAIAAVPAFCPHLHVPLQSGSDAVLAAMGRHYTAEQFAAFIGDARDALPHLAVTTDVIAGFPGETAAQADDTLALCEEIGFAKLHVFRYSERAGTPAAAMPGQVAPATKSERAAALRRTGDALRARYLAGRVGGEARVLIERGRAISDSGARIALGTSEDYVRVRVEGASVSTGQVTAVRLLSQDATGLVGKPLE